MTDRNHYLPACVLYIALALTFLVYINGLSGGFLFDDIPNLKYLGGSGQINDWNRLNSFLNSGFSGPTGRPISLLSFLINDNDWPSQATWYKPTNLAIHLLNGLFLTWSSLLLLRAYGIEEQRAQWFAVFTATCWLLHPFLVSTTLYVVQRMSLLAALFVFAGITGYLYGRQLLPKRPIAGYISMAGSLIAGTILATLSKENGALLPVLIGVIELCTPQSSDRPRPAQLFRAVFIWLPTFVILVYLLSRVNFDPNLWPHRSFNQVERLLTQPRILWDYLGNFFSPKIEGVGLYRDGLLVSRGLFTPYTTLPALLGILALLGFAAAFRRRWPLLSLAVLFFFAGHLVESTVIGLELYFEHRNYLPSAFLFLPMVAALDRLRDHLAQPIALTIIISVPLLLSFYTYKRATLWGDTEALQVFWATAATHSPRAQNALSGFYMNTGRPALAQETISKARKRMPDSSLLTMQQLAQRVWLRQATETDFVRALEDLRKQRYDAQTVMSLRRMVERIVENPYPSEYHQWVLEFLNELSAVEPYSDLHHFVRFVPYLNARLYLALNNPNAALEQFLRAIKLYDQTDAALQMVALMGSAGHTDQAQILLFEAQSIFDLQTTSSFRRNEASHVDDFQRLQQVIRDNSSASEEPSLRASQGQER